MEIKFFEIRDRGTFIPAMAIKFTHIFDNRESYLLARSGYGLNSREQATQILLIKLECNECQVEFDQWPNRTMYHAHNHIILNWDILKSAQVIDIEFILGESKKPKESEIITNPI